MMKREMISEAIGNIDEKFVSEADEVHGRVKVKAWRQMLPMAACICLR